METPARRIEIFAPFGEAYELTKRILFQPFDLAKWCVIGFAAFLANLGGGTNVNFRSGFNGKGDWKFRSTSTNQVMETVQGWPWWVLLLIAIAVVVVIVVSVGLIWVRARGEFIFTDAVVRNRGAIVEPWKQFHREGNSLFLFRLAVAFCSLVLVALAGLPLWLPVLTRREMPVGAGLFVGIALLAFLVLFIFLPLTLAMRFMPTIMYRQRCQALEAFRQNVGLLMRAPGPIILFFLFYAVLAIAALILMCGLTCVTCCITAIPYVGTVILLPIFVFWRSFDLFFLRQFGSEYDAWGVLPAIEPTPPPPVQTPPNEPPPLEPPALPA